MYKYTSKWTIIYVHINVIAIQKQLVHIIIDRLILCIVTVINRSMIVYMLLVLNLYYIFIYVYY
jgi:hypothetical protein